MSLTSCLANVRRDESKLSLADKEKNYIDRANELLNKINLVVFRNASKSNRESKKNLR